jgi:hypothetical protein
VRFGPGPPAPVYLAPVREGGARRNREIYIPANLAVAPESRITLGYTASNSYLNPGLLTCRDFSCQLSYATDHTGNLLYAEIRQPVLARFELGFGLGLYQMDEIPGWALPWQIAGDSALRRFHEDILQEESLPNLSAAPDGRQLFSLTDFDGRELTLVTGHAYGLPLRLDLTRYAVLKQTDRVGISLNGGLHLAVPIDSGRDPERGETAFARSVDAGVSINLVRTRRISATVSSTIHVQLGRFRTGAHVRYPDSPVMTDDSHRSQYALTYGLRFDGTFGGRAPCSFALSQTATSALYDQARHYTWDPLVFAGGNNLRGALAGANDYAMLSFACEHRGRSFQATLVEDIGGLSQLFGDDGAGTSYDPDFAVSLSVSWALGRGRDGSDQDARD